MDLINRLAVKAKVYFNFYTRQKVILPAVVSWLVNVAVSELMNNDKSGPLLAIRREV